MFFSVAIPWWLDLILLHLLWALIILLAVWVVHILFRTGQVREKKTPKEAPDLAENLRRRYVSEETIQEQKSNAGKRLRGVNQAGRGHTPRTS